MTGLIAIPMNNDCGVGINQNLSERSRSHPNHYLTSIQSTDPRNSLRVSDHSRSSNLSQPSLPPLPHSPTLVNDIDHFATSNLMQSKTVNNEVVDREHLYLSSEPPPLTSPSPFSRRRIDFDSEFTSPGTTTSIVSNSILFSGSGKSTTFPIMSSIYHSLISSSSNSTPDAPGGNYRTYSDQVENGRHTEPKSASRADLESLFGLGWVQGPSVAEFACSMHRIPGRLYVTATCILFYSRLLGFERRVILQYQDIYRMELYRTTSIRVSMLLPDDNDEEVIHVFRSFRNRCEVLEILERYRHLDDQRALELHTQSRHPHSSSKTQFVTAQPILRPSSDTAREDSWQVQPINEQLNGDVATGNMDDISLDGSDHSHFLTDQTGHHANPMAATINSQACDNDDSLGDLPPPLPARGMFSVRETALESSTSLPLLSNRMLPNRSLASTPVSLSGLHSFSWSRIPPLLAGSSNRGRAVSDSMLRELPSTKRMSAASPRSLFLEESPSTTDRPNLYESVFPPTEVVSKSGLGGDELLFQQEDSASSNDGDSSNSNSASESIALAWQRTMRHKQRKNLMHVGLTVRAQQLYGCDDRTLFCHY
jgi:hypothetical protein